MPDINVSFRDRIIGHAVQIHRFGAKIFQKVKGVLNRLEKELVGKIRSMELEGVSRDTYKRARAEKLLEQTRSTIKDGYSTIRSNVTSDLQDLSAVNAQSIRTIAKDVFKGDVLTVALTPQDLKSIAKDLIVDGNPASEWWGRQAEGTRMGYAREVRTGLAAGETTDDIVRRIRGRDTGTKTVIEVDGKKLVVPRYAGGVMDVSTRQAEALVRSSVQAVSNDVLTQTYKKNDDIVAAISLVATLDLRTCPICMGLDGGVWDLKTHEPTADSPVDEPYPGPLPLHMQCRCVYTPKTKSWAQLIREAGGKVPKGLKDLPESTRASMNGQVPAKLTYNDWLKNQSEAAQRDVLGKGRYELWKSGKLTNVGQLTDQSHNTLTLDELKTKLGG